MLMKKTLLVCTLAAAAGAAKAQATLLPDGRFRAALGIGASTSSGNSDATNVSLSFDGVRATEQRKSTVYANAQYASAGGVTTGEQFRLGGRHDQDLTPSFFAFGGLDAERNRFANLKLRGQASGGLGWHVLKSETTTFDIFGGLSYTSDRYIAPMLIDGRTRSDYAYAGLLFGEESTHKLTQTTSFKQRLTVMPNLKNSGEYRANWDAGLAVAMTRSMNLTVGAAMAYNSEPGPGRKRTDTLLTMGVAVKFE
jgi:putative salt-induced outer membrane protein YdiY